MREQNFTLHEKLESLRIMEGMARHEAKLLWTRFISVFYVHTAIIGIILALVWLRLISLSGYGKRCRSTVLVLICIYS